MPHSANHQASLITSRPPWVQLGVWGDSIVHGGCDMEMGGWVQRLRIYLTRRGLGDHVFNLGLGGNNSTDVLARIDAEIVARSGHIDHALVGVGVNDMCTQSKLIAEGAFARNLEEIVTTIRGRGKRPHLLTTTFTPAPAREVWQRYNDAIRQTAQKTGADLIELNSVPQESDLPDRVHPNGFGHEKVFHAVRTHLQTAGIIPPEKE